MSQSTNSSSPDLQSFGYRPFGLDPSKPTVLSPEAARLFDLYLPHLRFPTLAGPLDPIAELHKNGRWRSRYRIGGFVWAPLTPDVETLPLNFAGIMCVAS
jgi:hypothetical protein